MNCEICGEPYDPPKVKWNSGNPAEVTLPSCDCVADRIADEFIARLLERREREKM